MPWGGGGGVGTGETQGGPRLGGLGRRGAPGQAGKIAPPPSHAGPGALALGGPVRPEAGPLGTAGPLWSHHAHRVRHGSSG